ncbi:MULTISPECIES: hypothetical protein [unclassified Pseudomonas]|uniref:hypothetical protein n=1 Tax=unclassified Pseudomonas TaxID=196821 RepID=UPI0038005CD7
MKLIVDGVTAATDLDVAEKTFAQLRKEISTLGPLKGKTWQFVIEGDAMNESVEPDIEVDAVVTEGKLHVALKPAAQAAAKAGDDGKGKPAIQPESKPAAKPEAKTDASAGKKQDEIAKNLEKLFKALAAEPRQDLKGVVSKLGLTDIALPDVTSKPTTDKQTLKILQLIDQTLLSGKLPMAVTLDAGNIGAREDMARFPDAFSRLDDASRQWVCNYFLQSQLVTTVSTANTSVRALEDQALSSAHQSNAMHLVFGSSGKAELEVADVEAAGKAEFTRSTQQGSALQTRALHVSMVREVPAAWIKIPRELIEIPQDVQIEFDNALRAFEREIVGVSDEEREARRVELVRELQGKGLLIPQRYLIGGRLSSYEHSSSDKAISVVEEAAGTRFANVQKADIKGIASGGSEFGAGNSSTSYTSNDSARQDVVKRWTVLGGDAALAGQPQEWLRSVMADYSSMAVIGWDVLVPIWDFFAPDLRERFARHLSLDYLTRFFKASVKEGKAQNKRIHSLLSETRALAAQDFREKDFPPSRVSLPFGLTAEELPGSLPVESKHVAKDYALVGVRSDTPEIKAAPNHVLTYFAMSTSYDPPGKWKVINGGLLTDKVEVEVEAAALRGYAWTIKACQIEASKLDRPVNLLADYLCLKAMSNTSS